MPITPKVLPSQADLLLLFSYDAESGILTRLSTDRKLDSPIKARHRSVSISGDEFLTHRVIWKMVTGQEPPIEIDHRDKDGINNRWKNLRHADRSLNSANVGAYKTNRSSGMKWVSRNGANWKAQVSVGKIRIYVGTFTSGEEAHAAAMAVAVKSFGEYARAA